MGRRGAAALATTALATVVTAGTLRFIAVKSRHQRCNSAVLVHQSDQTVDRREKVRSLLATVIVLFAPLMHAAQMGTGISVLANECVDIVSGQVLVRL
jgi:hypothetical protein